MAQTQVLSIRLTLDEINELTRVARCPCCRQRISRPTQAAQAIIRAALAAKPELDAIPPEDDE